MNDSELTAARGLVKLALEEDLGAAGDLTSASVIPQDLEGRAIFVARQPGVIAGLPILDIVLDEISELLQVERLIDDGESVASGDRLAVVTGPMRGMLSGERTALNFLQRLSGIATMTNRYVQATAGTNAKILDTRKTTPGWRLLEKYAVRCGGGHNHRLGLYDGILIKDNHLAALAGADKSIAAAVQQARAYCQGKVPIEVEVDTFDQFDEALSAGADLILLDNMSPDALREAVRRRNETAPAILLEASGGITLPRIPEIAATGVDRISIGALTHSAPAMDIALDYFMS